jgi:superfamily I DNA/RNA helicase
MDLHASVAERLERLAPDQRAAATAPPGPVLCIAPAGSGKTTTLVARIAWLVAAGADPTTITAIVFNRRAAEDLAERLASALEPLGVPAETVGVRTFHALGRDILHQAGVPVDALVDRYTVIRRLLPDASAAERRRLDALFSRLKLDVGARPDDVRADPAAGPIARLWLAYEDELARTGSLDFDDLVARAFRLLEDDSRVLEQWRRSCRHLLVDEAQDLDRSQLRMALLLAAPANRVFLVGDDDQSIYGWRLADVRRVLTLDEALPGLRRIDLEVNYRCPGPVVERAVRLVTHNQERFPKRVRPGPQAHGRLVLAPDAGDDQVRLRRVIAGWPVDESTRAVLARTNRELLPAAALALEDDIPFRAPPLPWPLESSFLDDVLEQAARTPPDLPLLVRLGCVRDELATLVAGTQEVDLGGMADESGEQLTRLEVIRALLAWAPPYRDLVGFTAALRDRRDRLARLLHDDALLTLATAHATKGLEFDHVAVLTDGFPAARATAEAPEPARALEEERRLAYVAWTRARRSLTLVYDPATPSPFLREAFTSDELAPAARVAA